MELGLKQDGWTLVPLINTQRFDHTNIIGRDASFLHYMIQDLYEGNTVFYVTLDEDLDILRYIPKDRVDDVMFLDLADKDFPISFNPLKATPEQIPTVTESLVDAFYTIWADMWGPQLEEYLRYGIQTLLHTNNATFIGLKFLFTKQSYRSNVLKQVKDIFLKDYWTNDFEILLSDKDKLERPMSLRVRVGAFISDYLVRNILGQSVSRVTFDDLKGKFVVLSIPRRVFGQNKAQLLSSLFLSQLNHSTRNPTYVYLESDTVLKKLFLNPQLALTVKSLRPYDHVFGTTIAYRLGHVDAEKLRKPFGIREYEPKLDQTPLGRMYIKTPDDVNMVRVPVNDFPTYSKSPDMIRAMSRSKYARPKEQVEAEIEKFISRGK